METSSYFIQDKALFGSMPDQHRAEILEKLGVIYFIDLTSPKELNLSEYRTKHMRIKFPIPDRKIPKDILSFSKFVYRLYRTIKQLKENEKIYVHCKGGHGRSGIVVACLLCLYLKIPPEYALDLTRFYHQQRKEMRDKWRKIGSPQTYLQKDIVMKMFSPLYFNSRVNMFLCNSYKCKIETDVAIFTSVEMAYQAMKNPGDKKYIIALLKCSNLKAMKALGKATKLRKDWAEVKENVMHNLIKLKFDQNEELKLKLMNTFLMPITYLSKMKTFWKDSEHNRCGKIIQKIRNNYFLND